MREILFRGKRKDTGEWAEGFYMSLGGKYHYILVGKLDITCGYPDLIKFPVDPETVGQYTGLEDKNGKRIFEGDCINHPHNVVEYLNGEFCVAGDRPLSFMAKYGEVIGNIHDNKELMEGKA